MQRTEAERLKTAILGRTNRQEARGRFEDGAAPPVNTQQDWPHSQGLRAAIPAFTTGLKTSEHSGRALQLKDLRRSTKLTYFYVE